MSDAPKPQTEVIVFRYEEGGLFVETVFDPLSEKTSLARFEDGSVSLHETLEIDDITYIPIRATNNLIKHKALLFAVQPESYASTKTLIESIDAYLYRYVDLTDSFRKLAAYYVLLTWVYDAFNELPYLRLRGDYGSGKTRALSVIGSLCNKAFFASGASTVSPIFHTLDTFRGTLIFDEADFRFSDEKSELVKIFNNGNVRGFPILRTAITLKREFDPRAFNVYGPKVVAMRKSFDDPALESRFITEEMGQRTMRHDIPINLPEAQKDEALSLRNQLLMYRFLNLPKVRIDDTLYDPALSPRLNQILIPLLSIIGDADLKTALKETLRSFDTGLARERSQSIEAGVLEVILAYVERHPAVDIPIGELTKEFNSRFFEDYDRPLTPRHIGSVLRTRLRLSTVKRHGIYVLPVSELHKCTELSIRYGVTERIVATSGNSGGRGDLGTSPEGYVIPSLHAAKP